MIEIENMIIVKSYWEDIGAFDSASAESREKFAREYAEMVRHRTAKRPQVRVDSFDLRADLRAQDQDHNKRSAA